MQRSKAEVGGRRGLGPKGAEARGEEGKQLSGIRGQTSPVSLYPSNSPAPRDFDPPAPPAPPWPCRTLAGDSSFHPSPPRPLHLLSLLLSRPLRSPSSHCRPALLGPSDSHCAYSLDLFPPPLSPAFQSGTSAFLSSLSLFCLLSSLHPIPSSEEGQERGGVEMRRDRRGKG
eukprot:753710-Hanusia_phi.AAC.3